MQCRARAELHHKILTKCLTGLMPIYGYAVRTKDIQSSRGHSPSLLMYTCLKLRVLSQNIKGADMFSAVCNENGLQDPMVSNEGCHSIPIEQELLAWDVNAHHQYGRHCKQMARVQKQIS